MGSVAKHIFLVTDPNKLEATVRTAFEIARTGRPGPVVIDVPKDVQNWSGEFKGTGTLPIEGPRLFVQFADLAARERRHLTQIQATDLRALGGDPADRLRQEAAQDDGEEDRERGDDQSDQGAMAQVGHVLQRVLLGNPGAELPGYGAEV
jgi:hypothetical protein